MPAVLQELALAGTTRGRAAAGTRAVAAATGAAAVEVAKGPSNWRLIHVASRLQLGDVAIALVRSSVLLESRECAVH
jgi:hypothetical protein